MVHSHSFYKLGFRVENGRIHGHSHPESVRPAEGDANSNCLIRPDRHPYPELMLSPIASLRRRPVSTWIAAVTDLRHCSRTCVLARRHIDSKPSNRRFLTSKTELNADAKGAVATATQVNGGTTSASGRIYGTLPSTSVPRSSDTYTKDYKGPLALTFKRLKIFSLASLSLTTALSPFMFIIESNLPTSARAGLAGVALTTSGISTLLVGWCGKPYVETLRHLRSSDNNGVEGLEMTTLSVMLQKRITRVYDVDFLVQTERAFAKWELAEIVLFPPEDGEKASKKAGDPGQEETVAETLSIDGKVLGRWIVKWEEGGVGKCRQVGRIVR